QPVVVGAYVRIHQGTKRIKLRNFVAGGEHLVNGFLALAWGEANQQGERLGAAQGFASGPLREGGAENLRTGPFGEHFDLEAIQHGVACFAQAELRLDTAEIGTVRAEFAEEGRVMGGDSLADDGDSETRRGRRLRRHNGAQTIGVGDRGDSKGVELVSGPEMRRELFHKLSGSI